jgi:hypothetical protein
LIDVNDASKKQRSEEADDAQATQPAVTDADD